MSEIWPNIDTYNCLTLTQKRHVYNMLKTRNDLSSKEFGQSEPSLGSVSLHLYGST